MGITSHASYFWQATQWLICTDSFDIILQATLELLGSTDPSASVSQIARTIGVAPPCSSCLLLNVFLNVTQAQKGSYDYASY